MAYGTSSSRSLALIGLFSALYVVSAGIVSVIVQVGYPEHFLRGLLMTTLILRSGRKWSTTMMGAVCGIIFALVPAPAPYLLPSTFVSGLVFDLALIVGSYVSSITSKRRLIVGAVISGVAESLVALSILTYAGFFGSKTFALLGIAWSTDVSLNIVLSFIGALVAIRFFAKKN